jgi:hypothetical protein
MAVITRPEDITTATALAVACLEMVLFIIIVSVCPFSRDRTSAKNTAAVVVLMPPPQEPGEAPMNMRIMKKKRVAFDNRLKFTVLKPAVLAVTD